MDAGIVVAVCANRLPDALSTVGPAALCPMWTMAGRG